MNLYMGRAKRIWYLSPMRAAKVQASLRIRAVSPEPSLLAHTSSDSRGTFRQKARSLAPLNDWTCAVEICHDGMLEDTNSLDGAQLQCIKVMGFNPHFLRLSVFSSKKKYSENRNNIKTAFLCLKSLLRPFQEVYKSAENNKKNSLIFLLAFLLSFTWCN